MKEIEFLDTFCQFLDQKGYDYKREFRRGSYHNEGYVDVVIYHNKKFIAIEAKVNSFGKALGQAAGNFVNFHLSYILYLHVPNQRLLTRLNKTHIGLIIPHGLTHGENSFRIFKKSTSFARTIKPYITKIKRNWLQNRVGRILAPAEIPTHYDPQKVQQLRPTYEWVGGKEVGEGQTFIEDFRKKSELKKVV
jgi:hypothetical protein